MLDVCVRCASSCNSECHVLNCLEFVFSSIACVGSGSMFRVYWLLLNIVFFFSRGG